MNRLGVEMPRRCCGEAGFSLTELIIVIGLIVILLGLGTLNFGQWQTKTRIERQTRELFTDLNSARMNAIHTKKRHSVVLSAGSYILKNYSSENEALLAGRTIETKTVRYQLSKPGGSYSNTHYEFDIRGFLANSVGDTIIINPVNSGAAVDCIVLSVGRVNMGKMSDASTCTF